MSSVEVSEGSVLVEICGDQPLFYRCRRTLRAAAARDPVLVGKLAEDRDSGEFSCRGSPSCASETLRSCHATELMLDGNTLKNAIVLDIITYHGLGQSKAAPAPAPVGQPAPGVFLRQVCEALHTGPVVIISPSLSGMYSLPFLFQHSEQVKAYIPVASICTEKFTAEQYSSIQKLDGIRMTCSLATRVTG